MDREGVKGKEQVWKSRVQLGPMGIDSLEQAMDEWEGLGWS